MPPEQRTTEPAFNQPPMSIRKVFSAIRLGLLTFIATPVAALVLALPFFLFAKLSGGVLPESMNPVVWIGVLLPGGGLGALFGAQIIIIGMLLLLGDFLVAALAKWRLHLWKLGLVTFVSALIFQALFIYFYVVPKTQKGMRELSGTSAQFAEMERQFMDYARIGAASVSFKEPVSLNFARNGQMETRSVYKKAELRVPLIVQQPGNYEMRVEYGHSIQTKNELLNPGEQTVSFEFVADYYDDYGWSDKKRAAKIELSYIATSKEITEQMSSEIQNMSPATRLLYQKVQEQILREDVPKTVRKFVERKELEL